VRKVKPAVDAMVYKDFPFDCVVSVAVNPFTYKEVKLTTPVHLRCFDDWVRFSNQWEWLCEDLRYLGMNPEEVSFTLE
jgi:hypothetical protein